MEDAVRSYRRMATVAVLGALAAAALSSCGLKPETAATVGSTTITEKQVDQSVDSTGGKATRVAVVQDMVIGTACKNYASEKKISFDPAQAAQQLSQQGVPSGAYLNTLASKNACLAAIVEEGDTRPTEAELRKLYDDVTKLNPKGIGTYEQAKQQFLQNQTVTNAFGVRHVYTKIAKDQHISVNPRYRTLTFPLLATANQEIVLQVELGEPANSAVTDAPKPAATQAPDQPTS
jgi:hypothetical protein